MKTMKAVDLARRAMKEMTSEFKVDGYPRFGGIFAESQRAREKWVRETLAAGETAAVWSATWYEAGRQACLLLLEGTRYSYWTHKERDRRRWRSWEKRLDAYIQEILGPWPEAPYLYQYNMTKKDREMFVKFIEWLSEKKRIYLLTYSRYKIRGQWHSVPGETEAPEKTADELALEFFGIDLAAVEQEKAAIAEYRRKLWGSVAETGWV